MKKNTKLLDEMLKNLRKMNGLKLKWGFDSNAEYPEPRGISSVAKVAQLVEEGHANGGAFPNTVTPPRPFFKQSVEDQENHHAVRALIKHLQRKVLHGKISPEDKMEEIGELVTKQLRESIVNFTSPDIKESTLSMRENREISSTDPLRETDTMLNAVGYEIGEV